MGWIHRASGPKDMLTSMDRLVLAIIGILQSVANAILW